MKSDKEKNHLDGAIIISDNIHEVKEFKAFDATPILLFLFIVLLCVILPKNCYKSK